MHVEQNQVERLATARGMSQEVACLDAARGERGTAAPGLQQLQEHHAIRRVVVDDEHAQVGERAPRLDVAHRTAALERHREPERAAIPGLTVDADRASHHRDQPLRDREAKARTAVAPRRRAVRLRERLEDRCLLVGGDPDPRVLDGAAEDDALVGGIVRRRLRAPLETDHDLAVIGELQRVAGEVHQDLPQPSRIAAQARRQRLVDGADELELLAVGLDRQRVQDAVDDRAHVELDALEVELAGVDLREVEDVVDDRHQALGTRAGADQEVAPLGVVGGVERELRHPENAVHRGTDLVAHGCEELALGAVARLGRLFRRPQLLLGVLAVGDVADERREDVAVVERDGRDRELDREFVTVAMPRRHLDPGVDEPALAGREESRHAALVRLALRRRDDDFRKRLAGDLASAPAERRLGLHVPSRDAPVGVHHHDRVERLVDREAHALLREHDLLRQASPPQQEADEQRGEKRRGRQPDASDRPPLGDPLRAQILGTWPGADRPPLPRHGEAVRDDVRAVRRLLRIAPDAIAVVGDVHDVAVAQLGGEQMMVQRPETNRREDRSIGP